MNCPERMLNRRDQVNRSGAGLIRPVTADGNFNSGARETLLSKLKAFLRRAPQFLAGMKLVRKSNPGAKDSRIIPADILINARGEIVETYYGKDIGDHFPIDRLKAFAREHNKI